MRTVMVSDVSLTRSYRVEWWLPLPAGEWSGRWQPCGDGEEARSVGLSRCDDDIALKLVRVAVFDIEGLEIDRCAVDRDELSSWDPSTDPLPFARRDAAVLPPMGREDVEGSTLGACREALCAAVDAGALEATHVIPLIEIIQHAFGGFGPAVDYLSSRP